MDKAAVETVPAMLESIHEEDISDERGESGGALKRVRPDNEPTHVAVRGTAGEYSDTDAAVRGAEPHHMLKRRRKQKRSGRRKAPAAVTESQTAADAMSSNMERTSTSDTCEMKTARSEMPLLREASSTERVQTSSCRALRGYVTSGRKRTEDCPVTRSDRSSRLPSWFVKLEHKDEIDTFLQTIRELEGANLRLKAGLQQTSDDSVQASLKEAEEANSRINEELASRKKQMNKLQAQLEKVEFENFQPKGQLQQQSGAVKSLENRLEEVKADNRKLKQKGEAAEQGGTTHATQENLDKRTVKLDIQARDQELERGRHLAQGTILDREKKQHAETAEKDKVTHQAWMRERNAILYELNLKSAEIDDYARALDQWASRCRRKEREKNDAQIAYYNLQRFRVSLENDLRDFRHTVQDLQEANADLRLWMRSLDACCDVRLHLRCVL